MELDDKILNFIARFKGCEKTFLHGCCYWFATILDERFFVDAETNIKYEPVEGHFLTQIGNRFYDIRGDVTGMYKGKELYDLYELRHEKNGHKLYNKLMRECRDFEE